VDHWINQLKYLIKINQYRIFNFKFLNMTTKQVWNMTTQPPSCIANLTGHSWYINLLLELQNGNMASGSADNTIKGFVDLNYDFLNINNGSF
jgi:hypothetical protein